MRRLLFRGRTKDGKWCYGDYIHSIRFNGVRGFHKDWIIPGVYGNGGWVSLRGKYAVDCDTVGQYTGVKDKNGVMIFEHDIVRYEWLSLSDGKYKRFENTVVRFTDYSAFMLHPISESKELWGVMSELENCYEVIGNVFDNPELLEANRK